MIKKLITFAIEQRLAMVALTIVFIGYGLYVYKWLPVEAFPDVDDPQVQVLTRYPGQSAEDVEAQITRPAEEQLNSTPQLKSMRSTSIFGLSVVTMTFEDDVDINIARANVLNQMQQVSLPPGIQWQMSALTTSTNEVYRYVIKDPYHKIEEIRAVEDWVLEPAFRQVEGVGDFETYGGAIKQYQVVVKPERLSQNAVTLQQVFQVLQNNNLNIGGNLLKNGEQALVIRGVGLLRTVEEIGNVPVATYNARPVYIKDVADVTTGPAPRQGITGWYRKNANGSVEQADDLVEAVVLNRQGTDALKVIEGINGFLTQPHKVAIAKAQRLQAGIDMANQAFSLAQQVETQYGQLVNIARDGALLRRIADTYKQAVDEAQAQLKAGLVTRADFNRAVIAYEDALRQAHHLETQYEGAARQMNWLMGVQSAPRWRLPESAGESPQIIAALPDSGRLEELAGKYRLDLLRADYDRKIASTSVTLARLGFIPQTTLGFDAARDGNKLWTGGPSFSTSLPIFDPGIVAYWLARYQQEQTERNYITLGAQARQDVRNALNALQIAAEDVTFYRNVTIPQEEENVKLAQLSFKLGNSQFDDLLNSIREYVGVLQNNEDAIQAYHLAVIGLQTAVGLSYRRIELETEAGATLPSINPTINPTGPTTAPDLLPRDCLTPHTPFGVLDTTQPAATQPDTRP